MQTSTREAIVSDHIRVRCPDHFEVGEGAIVDDFCYFSTRVQVERYCHIASGCSIAGGAEWLFRIGEFSSLSSGVKVWCGSDDFSRDMVTIVPAEFGCIKEHFISGDVTLGRLTAVGANSVIMPGNCLPEGTVIGPLSYVPAAFAFEPWSVYAGVPVRRIKSRDRESVLRQCVAFEKKLAAGASQEVSE